MCIDGGDLTLLWQDIVEQVSLTTIKLSSQDSRKQVCHIWHGRGPDGAAIMPVIKMRMPESCEEQVMCMLAKLAHAS